MPDRVALARRVNRRLMLAHTAAHGMGALDVAALLVFVLPLPLEHPPTTLLWAVGIAAAVYLPVSFLVALRLALRVSPARAAWVLEGREPTTEERHAVLAHPMRCVRTDSGFWVGGAALFAAVCLPWSAALALHVASTILLGGLTVTAVAYLLDEKLMRPVVALALAGDAPERPVGPGVKGRLVLVWLTATGVPLLGLLMLACDALTHGGVSADRLAIAVLALAGAGVALGLHATLLSARALSHPLGSLRRAMARVQAGTSRRTWRSTTAARSG